MELSSCDVTGSEIFQATMNQRRFYNFLRALISDDYKGRRFRSTLDTLAPVRKLFDKFTSSYYQIGEYATIEILEGFRARCKFRQYTGNKPNKYGIIMYALVDLQMVYKANLEVYVGKQSDGPYKVDNSAHNFVMSLS